MTFVGAVHCKKYPYIHGYFVVSFPCFNETGSICFVSTNRQNNEARAHIAMSARASLFWRFTHANIYIESVKIWKTRHKRFVDIRIFFTMLVQVPLVDSSPSLSVYIKTRGTAITWYFLASSSPLGFYLQKVCHRISKLEEMLVYHS